VPPLEQWVPAVLLHRATTIYGGSNEIQKNIIAKLILGCPALTPPRPFIPRSHDMDFELNEDQKMLAETVADFAKKESPVERYRKLRDGDLGWDPKVWRTWASSAGCRCPSPSRVGGFGGTFVECALILEQLGKSLVPEPYLPAVVLGGMTVLRAGRRRAARRSTWRPMIEGETSLALAYAERDGRYDVDPCGPPRAEGGRGLRGRSGEKVWVLNGHGADHLVVSAKAAPAELGALRGRKDAKGLTVAGAHHRRPPGRLRPLEG
jgi:alkylation response protein AidB-like acyl-CoA dehydrogenase